MKASYSVKPKDLEYVGLGKYYHRTNIVEVTNDDGDKMWECDEEHFEAADGDILDVAKSYIKSKIDEYDSSDSVNSFFINGNPMWVAADLRVKLANVISIEKSNGSESFTEWYNGYPFTFPVTMWEALLNQVEHYAYQCLCTTETHKANVSALTDVESVINYDYKSGYPDKLQFNL